MVFSDIIVMKTVFLEKFNVHSKIEGKEISHPPPTPTHAQPPPFVNDTLYLSGPRVTLKSVIYPTAHFWYGTFFGSDYSFFYLRFSMFDNFSYPSNYLQ